jgi:hypothetical protein
VVLNASRLNAPEGLPQKPASIALPGNSLVVDSFVCVSDDSHDSNFERIANPRKRPHCNRATSCHRLPMAGGESAPILLAVAASLAEFHDSPAKSFEEFGVIYQPATVTFA